MYAWEVIGQPVVAYIASIFALVAALPFLYRVRFRWLALYVLTVPPIVSVGVYSLLLMYT